MRSAPPERGPRAVYVSHNSIGDPLVRSQVLAYLRGLAERGIDVDLVTFERERPAFPEGEFPRDRWHPLPALPGGHVLAKMLDVAHGVIAVARLVRARRADLIHARSYVPAAIAAVAGLVTGRPFIFDMRGFLGEEYVEGGHWRPGDLRLRLLELAERWLLRRASAIVVLTHAAARRLRDEPRYAASAGTTGVTVVPCMVDLARFRPGERDLRPTLVFSGAVGLRNLVDEVLAVFDLARRTLPDLRLLVLNRGQHGLIRRSLERSGIDHGAVELRSADFAEVPALLARAHVGIALQRLGRSKSGASAVKVAEYLACGLPAVVNVGHGDIADLVMRYRAGHVVEAYDQQGIAAAARAVVALAADEQARSDARRMAEAEYDLRMGVDRYERLYRSLVPPGGRR